MDKKIKKELLNLIITVNNNSQDKKTSDFMLNKAIYILRENEDFENLHYLKVMTNGR